MSIRCDRHETQLNLITKGCKNTSKQSVACHKYKPFNLLIKNIFKQDIQGKEVKKKMNEGYLSGDIYDGKKYSSYFKYNF